MWRSIWSGELADDEVVDDNTILEQAWADIINSADHGYRTALN